MDGREEGVTEMEPMLTQKGMLKTVGLAEAASLTRTFAGVPKMCVLVTYDIKHGTVIGRALYEPNGRIDTGASDGTVEAGRYTKAMTKKEIYADIAEAVKCRQNEEKEDEKDA